MNSDIHRKADHLWVKFTSIYIVKQSISFSYERLNDWSQFSSMRPIIITVILYLYLYFNYYQLWLQIKHYTLIRNIISSSHNFDRHFGHTELQNKIVGAAVQYLYIDTLYEHLKLYGKWNSRGTLLKCQLKSKIDDFLSHLKRFFCRFAVTNFVFIWSCILNNYYIRTTIFEV